MSINIKAEEGLIKLAPTSYNELTDLPNINSIGDNTYITNESGENIVTINSSGLETTGIVVDNIILGGKDISQIIAEGSFSGDFNDLNNNPITNESGNLTIVDESGDIGLILDNSGLQVKDVYAADGHQLSQKADQSNLESLSSTVSGLSGTVNDLTDVISIDDESDNLTIVDESGNIGLLLDESGLQVKDVYAADGHQLSQKADQSSLDSLSSTVSGLSGTVNDLTDVISIDDESGNLTIVDESGDIGLLLDESGLQVKDVYAADGHQLSQKADQSNLESLSSTVSGLSGTVTNLSNTKADKTEVNTLSNTVSGLSGTVSGLSGTVKDLTNAISIDDESDNLTIVDIDGNVGLILDGSGLQVKDVYTNGHQLSQKADQSDLDLSNQRISNIEKYFDNEADVDNKLNKWHEIVDFLDGIDDTGAVLEDIIETKANKSEVVTGPDASTIDHVAVFKDTTGKLIKDSGFTIASSVPSDAKFTDTTYTFTDGTNGFKVTPLGGAAQTVKVTPSIDKNVTYSGTLTSGRVATFDGTTGAIKDSGFTIKSSVPEDAKFTDTTYTFAKADGHGKLKITSSDGSTNTINISEGITTNGNSLLKLVIDNGIVSGFGGPLNSDDITPLIADELDNLSKLTDAISIDGESTNLTIADGSGNIGLILDGSGLQVKDVYTGDGKHQLSNKVSGPESVTNDRVAVFDGTTGKLIKDSGYTIASSVPSDAKFTDTTYSVMSGATSSAAGKSGLVPAPAKGEQAKFLRGDGKWIEIVLEDNTNTTYTFADGTNGFTVTPLGGTAQTVKVTPSIDKNVTYSGTLTSGRVATFDGTTGKIKASGYTIESSVPANAKFTDNNTTYTFAKGDNGKFTVTPSGGTAQTITAYEHYLGSISADIPGLHKLSFNREGHITGWRAVEKADITQLGIPAQDTTYSNMTLDEANTATSTEARTISANVLHNKIVATAATEPFTEEEIEAIIAELES